MLTVLQVAYPFAPVGPDPVGGAEQVLSAIDRALVDAGHRSAVIACEGSHTAGALRTVPLEPGPIDERRMRQVHARVRAEIARAIDEIHPDVVHLHGVDFLSYRPSDLPVLATLHLPPSWYPEEAFRRDATTHLHCVSASQRAACPPGAPLLEDVPNGVDMGRFRPAGPKRGYALVMGRICPEKGIHVAIDGATRAGVPLFLAGTVFPYGAHQRYFEEEIRPRLGGGIRFVGAVAGAEKRRLLAGAACVLVPSFAPETASLVSMEALASGTPVVARPVGALTEVVEEGRTGLFADDADGFARAMRRVDRLRPEVCRRSAERRFPVEQMVGRYLGLYRRLGRAGPSRRAASRTGPGFRPAASRETVRIEHVAGTAALSALSAEWEMLAARCPDGTPFQHPAWLLPCARHLAEEREVHAVLLRRGGRLDGMLALRVSQDGSQEDGALVLSLLGAPHSDYGDALLAPSARAQAPRLLAELGEVAGGTWTRGRLDGLRESSLLPWAVAPREWSGRLRRRDACPVLDLPRTVDELPRRFARGLASDLRASRRRARSLALSVETAIGATLDESFDTLLALHAARWNPRGERGVLADPAVRAFHREAVRELDRAGLLRLRVARLEGMAVAVLYGFRWMSRDYYYLGGFDPAHARLGPGKLVIAEAIEDAVRSNSVSFDFLRGREPYKYRWGATDRWNVEVRLER